MSRGLNDSFEVVLNGKLQIVKIENMNGRTYKVFLGKVHVGTLYRKRAGKFICAESQTMREFGGSTRREAVTHMIYNCYKDKEDG